MNVKKLILVAIAIFISRSVVFALGSGALGNQSGVSTKATAHGFAFAGVADDPSAIFYNPAGLTQVKGVQGMLGTALVDLRSEHTTPTGVKDEMASNPRVAPYLYASWSPIDSPWAIGLGINSPFGLITEWKDNSFSKYHATKSEILMYAVNPTIAYSVNEKFSVGGGINYFNVYKAELNQKVVNVDSGLIPGSPTGDGTGQLSGDGTGWGYNLGLLWKATEKHSFGLSYRSQVNVTVDGETELTNLQDGTAFQFNGPGLGSTYKTGTSTELKFPQSVLIGYGFRPNSRWTVFADYEWVNWNIVDQTNFNYDQNNSALTQSIPRNWRNTNNLGAGAEYHLNQNVDLRFGGLVYERTVPTNTLESSIPDSSRWALTVGSGFNFGDLSLNVGYAAIFFNNQTIDNNAGNAAASMDGEFETFVNVFNAGLAYRFGK